MCVPHCLSYTLVSIPRPTHTQLEDALRNIRLLNTVVTSLDRKTGRKELKETDASRALRARRAPGEEYTMLDRHTPYIGHIIQDIMDGTLSMDDFPYVKPPPHDPTMQPMSKRRRKGKSVCVCVCVCVYVCVCLIRTPVTFVCGDVEKALQVEVLFTELINCPTDRHFPYLY